MTHTVTLSGDTDVTLSSGVYAISYTPKSATRTDDIVTESAIVRVLASTLATQQAAVNNIEKVFEQARRRRLTGSGNQCYIKLLESGDSDTYRSELWAEDPAELPGRVVVLEPTMKAKIFDAYAAKLQVIWTRRNYWEHNSETELALTDDSGAGATGGQAVINPGYVQVESSDCFGTMPTPLRIEMTNSDSDNDIETMWIGLNYLSTPGSFTDIYEVEEGDTDDTADSDAHGGKYRILSVTTSETELRSWSITGAQLGYTNRRYFKALLRFLDGTDITNVKLRLKMSYNSETIWEGGQVEYDDTYTNSYIWRELDTIQLPPFPLEGETSAAIDLELWGISTTGETETIKADVLRLVPTDGYRKLVSKSGVTVSSILVDDGILNLKYQSISDAIVGDISAEGVPIFIWPGLDNRLYFTWHSDDSDTAPITDAISVQAYYRQRRSTL